MNSGPASLISRTRVIVFLAIWLLSVLLLYAGHSSFGWYHGQSWYALLPCLISIWPAPGVACSCLVFIQWLWVTDTSPLRKVCFTVLAIAISGPVVMVLGFFWVLMHMAP